MIVAKNQKSNQRNSWPSSCCVKIIKVKNKFIISYLIPKQNKGHKNIHITRSFLFCIFASNALYRKNTQLKMIGVIEGSARYEFKFIARRIYINFMKKVRPSDSCFSKNNWMSMHLQYWLYASLIRIIYNYNLLYVSQQL